MSTIKMSETVKCVKKLPWYFFAQTNFLLRMQSPSFLMRPYCLILFIVKTSTLDTNSWLRFRDWDLIEIAQMWPQLWRVKLELSRSRLETWKFSVENYHLSSLTYFRKLWMFFLCLFAEMTQHVEVLSLFCWLVTLN